MKKVMYWIPRIIALIYALLPITAAVIDSFRLGMNNKGFLIFASISLFLGFIGLTAHKWPKVGGLLFCGLGIIIIIGASKTDIGVDWSGILFGGIPMITAGILFINEGFNKSKSKAK